MNWHAFAAAHRRALVITGIVAGTTVAFGAGAIAMRGTYPEQPEVTVENASVEAADESTTTVVETTTTTIVETTTTTVAPTTTTTAPPPPPTTAPAPPPTAAPAKTYTFNAPSAGSINVKLENGVLYVTGVQAAAGWTVEKHTESGTEYVKVLFRQGNLVEWVKAWLKKGEVKPENGSWTECNTTPAAGTATYDHPGVGSITVTWNGSSFTLDAVIPAAGYVVASQEAPGDYVRVYFQPEAAPQTDGGHDGTKWIKVKIHECQITSHTG